MGRQDCAAATKLSAYLQTELWLLVLGKESYLVASTRVSCGSAKRSVHIESIGRIEFFVLFIGEPAP